MLRNELAFNAWEDQYQLIHHLVLYSNILMILQGAAGSGKTSYIEGLRHQLPEEFCTKVIDGAALDSAPALGLTLRQLFSLSTIHDDAQSMTNVRLVEQIASRQKHCILIVDNAHKLSDEVLSELLTCLQSQHEHIYFHCLLVGQASLARRFDAAPFLGCKDAYTHIFEMPELGLADARKYLEFKFASLGSAQLMKITDPQLNQLLEKSAGNLNVLNDLVSRQLIQTTDADDSAVKPAKRKERTSISIMPKLPRKALWGMVASVSVFALVMVLAPNSPEPAKFTKKLALPSAREEAKKVAFVKDFENRPALAKTVNLSDNPYQKIVKKGAYVPISMIPKYRRTEKVRKTQALNQTDVNGTAVNVAQAAATATASAPLLTTTAAITEAVTGRLQQEEKQTQKSSSGNKATIVNKPPTMAKAAAVKKVIKHAKINASVKKVVKGNKKRRRKSALFGKGYGIQLVASKDINAAKQYARKYHVYRKAKYYTTVSRGKKWVVLVLGDYSTKRQAQKAAAALPSQLKRTKPWVRSIKGMKRY